ncbi:hypothetical protein MKW92_015984, partial [Papaver armeniacum]
KQQEERKREYRFLFFSPENSHHLKEILAESVKDREYRHCMDTKSPCKVVSSKELTRESLIAISESIPDQTESIADQSLPTRESLIAISDSIPENGFASKISSENFTRPEISSEDFTRPNGIVVKDGDGADGYRSKLISLSYTPSPDN